MERKILNGYYLLSVWIIWLVIMMMLITILPILYGVHWTHPSPIWYRDLMYTMYIGWIILSIFASVGIGYFIWNHQKKKISEMSDEEIVEYYMTHGI